MKCVAIEIVITCRGCQQPVALNAIVARAACDRCGRVLHIPARFWRLVLQEPLERAASRKRDEKTAALNTELGAVQVVYRRTDPTCMQCRKPVAPEVVARGCDRYAYDCTCGARATCRWPEPAVDLPGVVALFQEDPDLLWPPPPRTEAAVLRCAACGAGVHVLPESPRWTGCTFCRAQLFIPDELWGLLHPVRAVRPFVLVLQSKKSEATVTNTGRDRAAGDELGSWDEVHDAICGSDGALFLAVTKELRDTEVWAMEVDGRVRWRKELPARYRDARLAWMCSGHLLIWAAGCRSMLGVRAADGVTEVELGANRAPGGVDAHFDLRRATSLVCDSDATILTVHSEGVSSRLARYSARGEVLPIWTGLPAHAPAPWAPHGFPPMLGDAPDQPVGAQALMVGVGWDGSVFLVGDGALCRFARDGKRIDKLEDPMLCLDAGSGDEVVSDARGAVYTWEPGNWSLCSRVEPSSGRRQKWLSGEVGGLLRGETRMAVAPDGTTWFAGEQGALRQFGPDRGLRWASAGARRADRDGMQ